MSRRDPVAAGWVVAGLCVVSGAAHLGCVSRAAGVRYDAPSEYAWPFRPSALRVHPLSRRVTDRQTGRVSVEAHIELRDPWGATVKGVGSLRLEVYGVRAPGASGRLFGPPLVADEIDLSAASAASAAFAGGVGGIYRVLLTPSEGIDLPRRVRVVAVWTTLEGAELRGELEIE